MNFRQNVTPSKRFATSTIQLSLHRYRPDVKDNRCESFFFLSRLPEDGKFLKCILVENIVRCSFDRRSKKKQQLRKLLFDKKFRSDLKFSMRRVKINKVVGICAQVHSIYNFADTGSWTTLKWSEIVYVQRQELSKSSQLRRNRMKNKEFHRFMSNQLKSQKIGNGKPRGGEGMTEAEVVY